MTKPPDRDWDKELADIDKIIAKHPVAVPSPSPAAAPSPRPTPPAGRVSEPPRHRVVLTTWLRVLLAIGVAAAMTQWPYAHGCGTQLLLYLGAAAVVVVAGLWGSVMSWKRRMAMAHALSLLVTLWGGYLAGKVVLDRSSYPRAPLSWSCP